MALAEILEKPPRELRLFLSFSHFFATLFGVSLHMAGPVVKETWVTGINHSLLLKYFLCSGQIYSAILIVNFSVTRSFIYITLQWIINTSLHDFQMPELFLWFIVTFKHPQNALWGTALCFFKVVQGWDTVELFIVCCPRTTVHHLLIPLHLKCFSEWNRIFLNILKFPKQISKLYWMGDEIEVVTQSWFPYFI